MKFKVLAGPCVIESEESVMYIAENLKSIMDTYNVDFYFKASFDKANRSSLKSYRGPGLDEGIKILEKVKSKYNVKIVTDIHESCQASKVASVADIIQIPAFLCRQTDLLVAAAKTNKIINVKKAQFLAPWDMKNVIEKLKGVGCDNIMLCERGTTFGYNRLVVDMTGIVEMKKFGYPVIFDATHSVQMPGGNGTTTGGNREYVEYLARAATAVGVDGVFAEVHPYPDKALSDGPNMITIEKFEEVLSQMLEINEILVRREIIV
ncbi:2-dehydro-3-deoxyphosphooctonate aldolase [uncultured Roseburia sp.]|nr:2-dehydro-3-deoxyphosphooctonate aldolase [uncultured Roseburia sp.]